MAPNGKSRDYGVLFMHFTTFFLTGRLIFSMYSHASLIAVQTILMSQSFLIASVSLLLILLLLHWFKFLSDSVYKASFMISANGALIFVLFRGYCYGDNVCQFAHLSIMPYGTPLIAVAVAGPIGGLLQWTAVTILTLVLCIDAKDIVIPVKDIRMSFLLNASIIFMAIFYLIFQKNRHLKAVHDLESHKARVAEAESKYKTEFMSRMSHELKTPLAVMTSATEHLIDGNGTETDRWHSVQLESCGLLRGLLDNVLVLHRIETGQQQLTNEPFSIRDVADGISKMLSVSAHLKKINFSVTVDDSVADSHIGDSVRVRQVIMNLGSNAIRFTDEGSVSITIAALSDDDQSQTLRICVTDTGIGMTQEQQESILDVDTVTVPERGGSGLGLKIVQNIVKMMQGSVRFESNAGTTFCADIVLVKVTDVSDQDELLADVTPEHCVRNVLLVEDNIHIQTLVGITLAATGHTYTVANNGQEAIDRFTADTFDIVLMDIRMPVMGGIEATKAIREIDRHVPIVAMTAHSLRSEVEECFEAGCSGYLPKPVDHAMLLATVESLGESSIHIGSLPGSVSNSNSVIDLNI